MGGAITTIRRGMTVMLAVLATGWLGGCAAPGGPRTDAAAQGAHAYRQAELDQMLAPVALYPDSLLSQLLMASTYPLEVVEAARWSRNHPDYRGDEAVKAVEYRDWDPSVKSLAAFPQVLATMDQHLRWTENLGDAFLSQRAQVMDTIQKLRHKAYAAGTLRSNGEITVVVSGAYIYIEYALSDVAYVPYYDSTVVFGDWWWTDYPPMVWAPWSGYNLVSGFSWGSGTYVSTGFFFGSCDWRDRRVDVANVRSFYYNPRRMSLAGISRYINTAPGPWRHNPAHRRGVPYHYAGLRHAYGRPHRSSASRGGRPGYRAPGYLPPAASAGTPRGWHGSGASRGAGGPGNRFGTGSGFSPPGLAASPASQGRMPAAAQGGRGRRASVPAQQGFQTSPSRWRRQNSAPAQNQPRFQASQRAWRRQNGTQGRFQQRFQAPRGQWRRQGAPIAVPRQQAPVPSAAGGMGQAGMGQTGGGGGGWSRGGGGGWGGHGRAH